MEKLSIEQKAEACDKAYKRVAVRFGSNVADEIFPELAESEDERIRKALLEHIKGITSWGYFLGISREQMIAWLEKQGEVKPANNEFKVGDWVVNTITKEVEQVIELTDNEYICSGHLVVSFNNQHLLKEWTIQDAKDGDVLYTSSTASNEVFIFKGLTIEGYIECYCSYDSEDKYCEGKYLFIGRPTFKTHPATKEKRDLLFQKMKEAGYEWDAEKKELKNIEQTPTGKVKPKFHVGDTIKLKDGDGLEWTVEEVHNNGYYTIVCADRDDFILLDDNWELVEQKPSWNKEDEQYVKDALALLAFGASVHTISQVQDWLKFLKDRYSWKPSDEQMITLRQVISGCSYDIEPLVEMEEQLKKLKK